VVHTVTILKVPALKLECWSPNIFRVTKSGRRDGARHVARTGAERCTQGSDGGYLKERDHLEDIGIEERIILK